MKFFSECNLIADRAIGLTHRTRYQHRLVFGKGALKLWAILFSVVLAGV